MPSVVTEEELKKGIEKYLKDTLPVDVNWSTHFEHDESPVALDTPLGSNQTNIGPILHIEITHAAHVPAQEMTFTTKWDEV